MPDKKGRMTPQERVFAAKLAKYGDPVIAAKEAGYADPHSSASQKMRSPMVVAEAERQARSVIRDTIIPLALGRMTADLKKPTTSTKDVIGIYKAVAPYGFTEKAPTETELHEKSASELDAMIAALERRLAVLTAPDVLELEAEPVEPDEPAGGVFD